MKSVNKNDIISMVVSRTGEKKDLASKMVNETLTAIRISLCDSTEGTKLSLHDFGIFEVKTSRPRLKLGEASSEEPVIINSHRKVVFIPGQFIKKMLNQPHEE